MKRHLLRHFVDVKMDTTSEGTAADYRLLGTGGNEPRDGDGTVHQSGKRIYGP